LAVVAKDINQAVREVCLSFPESEEFLSHGSPNFRVRGKTFATYVVNHHGDGRVALWLSAPAGAQEHFARSEPKHFFVPPYVGPRGWLGVHLDKGLSWKRVAELVRQAYEKVAPRPLADSIGKTIVLTSAPRPLAASDIDPLKSRHAQSVLKQLRAICLAWPETSEGDHFGSPGWRAGKKMFAYLRPRPDLRGQGEVAVASGGLPRERASGERAPRGSGSGRSVPGERATDKPSVAGRPSGGPASGGRTSRSDGRPTLQAHFWVGVHAQGLMTTDPRYEIPPYMGHNGWIALDVTRHADWQEVRGLALESYRHFALKRMLTALEGR
jgi:predicted DNA-binding protein (MmcQ/YjbR family)